MNTPKTPQRRISESTRQRYLDSIESMRTWSVRKHSQNPDEPTLVEIIDLAQDIIAREDLSARSKNAYRAALLWRLRQFEQLGDGDRAALELLEGWATWKLPKQKLRPRTISQADVERLYDQFLLQGGKWSVRTSHWLMAGLATGLRPREWLDARWTCSEHVELLVQCGKTKLSTPAFLQNPDRFEPREETYGTGTVERTIPVLKGFDRMVIEEHMGNIQFTIDSSASREDQQEQFARYYHQCRACIRNACQRIWKGRKMYSLYTLRSQFAANAKAAYGSDGAAILMGHSSADSPSAAHYGKARQSHIPSTRISTFAGVPPKAQAPAQTDADAVQAPSGEL